MKRVLVLLVLVLAVYATTADAQGRFWVLVNGALRYTGQVQINTGPVLFPNGTAGAPSISFASDTGIGFYRNVASTVNLSGDFVTSANETIGGSSEFRWSSRADLASPADGLMTMTQSNRSTGVELKFDVLPTVSACGSGSPAVTAGSTPFAGSVTIGTTSVATCTISWGGTAYPSAPFCVANVVTATAGTTRAIGVTSTTGTVVLVPASAFVDSSIVAWHCISSK